MMLEYMINLQKCYLPRRWCYTDLQLDYPYCKKSYKKIVIDINKRQVLDADPKAMQQVYFLNNLKI